ncbi:hypothetical protein [Massilia soli]|uniref:Uncharacterized protein n=1 Tax=Massilia soli TaxID=2792854 RepID=A0ABS7SNC7_9BURK|nr:hypothetical protein [Massilia soli]MBZ2207688.1 hypothetical protein [Massilia soli]
MEKYEDKRPSLLDVAISESAPGTVERLLQRWHWLAEKLTPLVGERGFCALYSRAVRLVLPSFGWLNTSKSCTSTTVLLDNLRSDLTSVDSGTADAGNTALFTTFTKLLTALIGEALTNRLLASEPTEQKHVQEHK